MNLLWKGVANGQSLDDAATFEFAWTGQSLKAKPPGEISGSFDVASGSLLLDWLDETQAVPGSDPTFELEIRNSNPGTTTLRGPLTIRPLELQRISGTPPLKSPTAGGIFLPSTAYTFINPGGFDVLYTAAQWDGGKIAVVESESPFSLAGGMMIEYQVSTETGNGGLFPSFSGILPTVGGDPDIAGWVKVSADSTIIQPRQAPAPDYNRVMVAGDRYSVQVSPDGTVAYYINYMGAMSDPWYVSPVKLNLSLEYRLQFSNTPYDTGSTSSTYTISVRNARWLRNLPEFNYTGDMQRADNSGSLPATVHVRVRKKSDHPIGPPSNWRYASFARP